MLRLHFQREALQLPLDAAPRARSLVAAGELLQCCEFSGAHRSCTRVEFSARCVDALEALLAAVYDAKALSEARR